MKNKNKKNDLSIKSFILITIITIVVVFIITSILISLNLNENSPVNKKYPELQVELMQNNGEDQLIINHVKGEPLNLSYTTFRISNDSNFEYSKFWVEFDDVLLQGEQLFINSSNTSNFGTINYQTGLSYQITIWDGRQSQGIIFDDEVICK